MVTRAIMRTVVFDTAFMPSSFCEVLQAVIHLSDAGGCWPARIPEPDSAATPATMAIPTNKEALVMPGSVNQVVPGGGRKICCVEARTVP
jgi:hypothetical protein